MGLGKSSLKCVFLGLRNDADSDAPKPRANRTRIGIGLWIDDPDRGLSGVWVVGSWSASGDRISDPDRDQDAGSGCRLVLRVGQFVLLVIRIGTSITIQSVCATKII